MHTQSLLSGYAPDVYFMKFYVRSIFIIDVYVFDYFNVHLM